MSEIQITVRPRAGCDERYALQRALKYMGRLGLCCIRIHDTNPPTAPTGDATRQTAAQGQDGAMGPSSA